MRVSRRVLSLLSLILISSIACAPAAAIIKSRLADDSITVDGDLSDWEGMLMPVENAPFSLGVRQDGERLYLALASADQGFREQVVRRGLVLWFDTDGGKDKTSGIRFPRGLMDLGSALPGGSRRAAMDGGEEITPAERADFIEKEFEGQLETLSFVGSEGSSWSMDLAALQGLALAASMEEGRFLYEASLPLFKGAERSYSLGLEDRSEFTLGVEVPLPEMPGRGESRSGDMGSPPGGMGGRGGGMGEGRGGGMGSPPGGMRPGGQGEQPQDIEHWFRIELTQ